MWASIHMIHARHIYTHKTSLCLSPQEIYLTLDCSLEITRPSTIFTPSHTHSMKVQNNSGKTLSPLNKIYTSPYCVYYIRPMIGFMLSPWSCYKAFSHPPLYIIKRSCHYFWWLLSGIPLKIELPARRDKTDRGGGGGGASKRDGWEYV